MPFHVFDVFVVVFVFAHFVFIYRNVIQKNRSSGVRGTVQLQISSLRMLRGEQLFPSAPADAASQTSTLMERLHTQL